MIDRPLPQTNRRWPSALAFLGALLLAGGLFMLIPLTQALGNPDRDPVLVRAMTLAAPPPPPQMPPPPEELKAHEEEIEPEPPELQDSFEEVEVQRLQVDLNPGRGAIVSMGMPNMPQVQQVNTVAEIEKIFNFDELAQPPRVVNAGMVRLDFPRELSRRRIRQAEAVVEILIDKTGKVRQAKIISVSHELAQLRASALKTAKQFRFTITKVDGRAVEVRGRIPIALRAP